jgi:hypothetical protein
VDVAGAQGNQGDGQGKEKREHQSDGRVRFHTSVALETFHQNDRDQTGQGGAHQQKRRIQVPDYEKGHDDAEEQGVADGVGNQSHTA